MIHFYNGVYSKWPSKLHATCVQLKSKLGKNFWTQQQKQKSIFNLLIIIQYNTNASKSKYHEKYVDKVSWCHKTYSYLNHWSFQCFQVGLELVGHLLAEVMVLKHKTTFISILFLITHANIYKLKSI